MVVAPFRAAFAAALVIALGSGAVAEASDLAERVTLLLEDLGSSSQAEQQAAEAELDRLAGESLDQAEEILAALPTTQRSIPPRVFAAIERVRLRIERGVAKRATGASRVTLTAVQTPLAEVLGDFEKQTGVKFRDNRAEFGGDATPKLVTLRLEGEPFWSAVDQLLDATDLDVYPYGDDGEMKLVDRGSDAARRHKAGNYAGPFRFEPLSLSATRGLRDEAASRLDLEIEVAWEPRLRPIAISQPLGAVTIVGSDGKPVLPRTPNQSIDLEATTGEQSLRATLSMALPERSVTRIEKLSGQMIAMVPAARREFRVEQVGAAKLPVVREFGDAVVTLERLRKQNTIWELHMRLQLKDAGDALASHRGWVFQNACYLVDANGERVEHAGFETTMQTDREIGVAYLFDLSGGDIYGFGFEQDAPAEAGGADADELDMKALTWVYETPTGVYTVPVTWELGPIELP